MQTLTYGAQSMSAPLREVLVHRPGAVFGQAYDDPRHGYLRPVDLDAAQREHDVLCQILTDLGANVHELGAESGSPDLTYTFDPVLVTDAGTIVLHSGKPTRQGEEQVMEQWLNDHGVPTAGRLTDGATADGGDTFWLDHDTLCIGRSLRTNRKAVAQIEALVEVETEVFDVVYDNGAAECLHLMSVISPVADDIAVVYLPLLPCGLYELLQERGIRMVEVPEDEYLTLGANVLAAAPGVCVVADGNPRTRQGLLDAGCEVHVFPAGDVGVNGSGGPTCLTRPILRG